MQPVFVLTFAGFVLAQQTESRVCQLHLVQRKNIGHSVNCGPQILFSIASVCCDVKQRSLTQKNKTYVRVAAEVRSETACFEPSRGEKRQGEKIGGENRIVSSYKFYCRPFGFSRTQIQARAALGHLGVTRTQLSISISIRRSSHTAGAARCHF